ncbi:hypothetical protein BVX93_01670 [bacterium B13(2017)]|nr:hypothetical protein BVX93_01670 [bacterium B13(2017)]
MTRILQRSLICYFLVTSICALEYVSSQDGGWSIASTWGGVGVPGDSDVVKISHNVIVDVNVTIGHSPLSNASTAAIEINSEGSLTIANEITLVCRGDLKLTPGYLTLLPGAVLEMDSSQSSSPATSIYKIDIVPEYGNNNALLQVNGTANTHCEIRSNPQGATTYITDGNGTENGGRMIAEFCDFKGLSSGSPDYIAWIYNPTSNGDLFKIADCTFDNCGQLKARNGLPSGSYLEYRKCIFENSILASSGGSIHTTGADLGATVKIIGCYFDERVFLYAPNDYEIEDNVFVKGVNGNSGEWYGGYWKSFKRNYVRWVDEGETWAINYSNKIEDCIIIKDMEGWNPHYFILESGTGSTDLLGNIFWFTGTGTTPLNAEGDVCMIFPPSEGSREDNTITMEKNIFLPNGQGPDGVNNITGCAFVILWNYPGANQKQVVFKRNTVYAGAWAGGCNVGENVITETGSIAYFKSNLFVGTDIGGGAMAGYKIHDLGDTEIDVVAAENADYNASYRLADALNYGNGSGKGYEIPLTSGSMIGENDIDDVDPQFVDKTRTPFTWDSSLGGPGTMQGVMGRLKGNNTIQELLDYIREGFRPQNPILKNAGDPSDGSPDIGAVDFDRQNPILNEIKRLKENMSSNQEVKNKIKSYFN